MRIPLNMLHWYIGLVVVTVFAIRGLMAAHRTKNRITLFLGLAGLWFAICFCFYGLPPLFTLDPVILTTSTMLGDIASFIGLFFVWMAVARAYAPNSRLGRTIILLYAGALLLAGSYFSIVENLANPVRMAQLPSGVWNIYFSFSRGFEVVTALQYFSFILIAIKFWQQAAGVTATEQRWRLRTIALGFFIVGCVYFLRIFANTGTYTFTMTLAIALGILIAGLFVVFAPLIKRIKR